MADTIIQRLPTSDYLVTNWSQSSGLTKYACIDDTIGAYDSDTTYVFIYVVTGSNILFGYTAFDVPSGAQNIKLSIKIIARRDTSSYTPRVAGSIKIDSTVYTGTYQDLTDSYAEYVTTWESDPSTSAAWTVDGVNGVDYIGAYGEKTGLFGVGYSQTRITQLYAEVSYNFKKPYCSTGPCIVAGAESVSAG